MRTVFEYALVCLFIAVSIVAGLIVAFLPLIAYLYFSGWAK